MTSLKGADAKEIASSITAIANEKLKAEKEANAGKKKTGKSFWIDFPLVNNCYVYLFFFSFIFFSFLCYKHFVCRCQKKAASC